MPTTSTTATSTTATSTTATGDLAVSSVQRAGDRSALMDLAELVCADPDLLRREFAELIAANYPPAAAAPVRAAPPRRLRVDASPVGGTRGRPGARPSPPGGSARPEPRPAVVVEFACQRSPPGRLGAGRG